MLHVKLEALNMAALCQTGATCWAGKAYPFLSNLQGKRMLRRKLESRFIEWSSVKYVKTMKRKDIKW